VKKLLFLSILILFFNIFGKAFCQTPKELKETLDVFSQNEFIKSERNIPKKLESIGFTKYNLISYYFLGNAEYFTFSDWRTEEKGDVVTFVVIDGEVEDYLKEEKEQRKDVGKNNI